MWTPVPALEDMKRSSPVPATVDEAKDCDATVEPFNDVIEPPAPPASVPQKNVPLFQRSFSVELLQLESPAP